MCGSVCSRHKDHKEHTSSDSKEGIGKFWTILLDWWWVGGGGGFLKLIKKNRECLFVKGKEGQKKGFCYGFFVRVGKNTVHGENWVIGVTQAYFRHSVGYLGPESPPRVSLGPKEPYLLDRTLDKARAPWTISTKRFHLPPWEKLEQTQSLWWSRKDNENVIFCMVGHQLFFGRSFGFRQVS